MPSSATATMSPSYQGLDSWANSVRMQLSSATGAADFAEFVQVKGFDWLNTYVNGVLNDEPIVELAKTPGRQKSVKKTRARTAAIAASAAKIKAINLQNQADTFEDKENFVPSPTRNTATKLQQAFLQAKQDGESDDDEVAPLPAIKPLAYTPRNKTVATPVKRVQIDSGPTPSDSAGPSNLKSLSFTPAGSPPKRTARFQDDQAQVETFVPELPQKETSHTRVKFDAIPEEHPSSSFSTPSLVVSTPSQDVMSEGTSSGPVSTAKLPIDLSTIVEGDEKESSSSMSSSPRRLPKSVQPPPLVQSAQRDKPSENVVLEMSTSPRPSLAQFPLPPLSAPSRVPELAATRESDTNSASVLSVPLNSPTPASIMEPNRDAEVAESINQVLAYEKPKEKTPELSHTPSLAEKPLALETHQAKPEVAHREASHVADPVPRSSSPAPVPSSKPAPLNTSHHEDLIVPTKQSSPVAGSSKTVSAANRSSWVARALAGSRGSSGTLLRKSSFVGLPRATLGHNISDAASSGAAVAAGTKRKSEVVNADDEPETTDSGRVKKALKLETASLTVDASSKAHSSSSAIPTQTEATGDMNAPSVATSSQKATSPVDGSSQGSQPPKTGSGLSHLAALLEGMQKRQVERTHTGYTTTSNAPVTRTFSLSELEGDSRQKTAGVSSESESESDEQTSDEAEIENEVSVVERVERGHSVDANDDDDELKGHDDNDIAMKITPASFTPPDSPPSITNSNMASRAYSIPEGRISVQSHSSVSAPSRSNSHSHSHSRSRTPQAIPTSSSNSSIFTTASNALSSIISSTAGNIFGSAPQRSPQESVAPAAPPVAVGRERSLLTFNPFAPSPKPEHEPSRVTTIKTNPFLMPSPSPPKEIQRQPSSNSQLESQSQMTQPSQSTVLSSQASGASWFGPSQSRLSDGQDQSFYSDFTESQLAESQPSGGPLSDKGEEKDIVASLKDVKAKASLKAESETDIRPSQSEDRMESEEDANVPEPVKVSAKSKLPTAGAAKSLKPTASTTNIKRTDDNAVPQKTLKHVKSFQTLRQGEKRDESDKKLQAARDEERMQKLRKDDDVKGKQPEAQKKKEDLDKRKREDPTPAKPGKKKAEEDPAPGKKRKLESETKPLEKFRPVTKGTPSTKATLASSQSVSSFQPGHSRTQSQTRPIPTKSSFKPLSSAGPSTSTVKLVSQGVASSSKSGAIMTKSAYGQVASSSINAAPAVHAPTQALQAKMQASLRAEIAKEKEKAATVVQAMEEDDPEHDESIVLPDIASEYSNSDDEDRPRYDLPNWANPEEVERQLDDQGHLNPDDIFGPIPTLNMAEVFKSKGNKFRNRTSSANWTGTDALTQAEELEYAKKMGFE